MRVDLIYNSKVSLLINGKEKIVAVGDLAIRQGATYNIKFRYEGDYSLWLPKAQIRNNYLNSNGEVLADFEFSPLVYVDPKTEVTMRLDGEITASLPITKYQGKETDILSTNNCLVYDVELVDPSDSTNVIKMIDWSFIQVMPEVTQ